MRVVIISGGSTANAKSGYINVEKGGMLFSSFSSSSIMDHLVGWYTTNTCSSTTSSYINNIRLTVSMSENKVVMEIITIIIVMSLFLLLLLM